MPFHLATLARRARNVRRSSILIRDIAPPSTLASDLFATYRRVIEAWGGHAERIIAEYERSLATLTTDAPADVQREIDAASDSVSRLILMLTPEFTKWAMTVERWYRRKWIGAVLAATSVDLTTMIGPEGARAALATHIEWNTALIKDVSAQARQRIGNAVFDGLRNRTPAREVAKLIREAVDMGRRRSLGIAADQLSKLTSALADERRREAGITAWEWVHSRKAHPRAQHVARNGNYYTDDPADVGKVIAGKTLLAPPPTRPSQEPYCGCRSKSVISFD